METKTLLNVADQALLVDILIATAQRQENQTILILDQYLTLIDKVKSLELEEVKTDLTIEQMLNDDLLK